MMEFVQGGEYSGLTDFMPDEWRTEHRKRRNPLCYVPIIGFEDLLREAKAPSIIDYLSLDTEGSEYDILEGFFQLKSDFRINLITVEFRYDALLLRKYTNLLEHHGYELLDVRGFDACYANTTLARHPNYAARNWRPPKPA